MGMMSRRNKKYKEALKNIEKATKEVKKPVKKETVVETPLPLETEKKEYSKTDILTMNVANLRALATEQGVEGAENISGTKLKDILIEKLGL